MRQWLNKKSFRIALGIIFLLLLVLTIVPNLYLYSSSDGVVNAHTTTLTSPIEGVLHYAGPMQYGREFRKGELIGKIQNDRVNQSFLYELMTEKKTLDSRIASFAERIDRFSQLSRTLAESLAKYQAYSVRQLDLLIKEQEYVRTEEHAEFERAKKEYEAVKELVDKAAVNKRELERTESNYLRSTERLQKITSKLEELKVSLEAVKLGAFLGDGHNDSPYSKQRMDQLIIELSLAQTTYDEAKSRVEGINRQLEIEKARIAQAECFEFAAPFHALVWRESLTEGSTVVIDSELVVLLDCASIFLDIAVSENQFSNIAPGDQIKYRLIGESGYHRGTIYGLRGSGTQLGDSKLAATLSKDPKREFRVWVRADPKDLDLSAENFFQVGRRVEVKLPRKWRLGKALGRMIDVF